MSIKNGDKPPIFENCRLSHAHKSSLTSQSKDKLHIYGIYEKLYVYSCGLTKHTLVYTEDKPQSCRTCEKKLFAQNKQTFTLIGDKSHKCRTCGKSFTAKGNIGPKCVVPVSLSILFFHPNLNIK